MNQDLELWDKAAGDWDSQIAHEGTYRTLLISSALDRLLTGCQSKGVLDAGCGNGFYSNWLAEKGARVTGMDGSVKMVEIARKKYPDIEFQVQDFLQPTSLPGASLDVILANMLLMHLSEIGTFLGESRRLLKPGGQLVFSVLHPAFNVPTARLHKSLWQKLTFAKPSLLSNDYYSRESGRFESHMGSKLTHYHRTLEKYSQDIKSAGLCITEMAEPHELPLGYLNQEPKHEYATRFPRFIFFNCTPL
jgi:2-polyprenyl-3-methyl-5-hydroxy-6-metoxy-1,4-benzoquinol methylase